MLVTDGYISAEADVFDYIREQRDDLNVFAFGIGSSVNRLLIEGVARIHDMEVDADALEPIPFEELASVVSDEHRRKRAVQLAIVMALVEGTPDQIKGNSKVQEAYLGGVHGLLAAE